MDDAIRFYDQWKGRAPEDYEDGPEPDFEPNALRHLLPNSLTTGAGVDVACIDCERAFWVLARHAPAFRCISCQWRKDDKEKNR